MERLPVTQLDSRVRGNDELRRGLISTRRAGCVSQLRKLPGANG